jgi:hypothetical protein
MRHPRRNEVYRDVGTEEHTPDDPEFIELIRIPFEDDSAVLLCSDGLTDQVTSTEILRAVTSAAGNPDGAIQELISAANRAGGKDNVSVLIAEAPLFGASSVEPSAAERAVPPGWFQGRSAMAVYGFFAGALLLAALQSRLGLLKTPGPPASPSASRVLVVGTGEGAQFSTIGDALSQARAGDTIDLQGGEYREQVRLRDGVNITSRVPHSAILRASPAAVGPAIIAENSKNIRITGLRILADDKLPLAIGIVLAGSDVEVDDCEIAGAGTGIEIRGNARPILRANSVHDSLNSGILISGDATPWLSHNEIARNGRNPHEPRPGVLISGAARPVLIGNVFADNGAQGVIIPPGMDSGPVAKFNFFLNGEPVGHTPPETARGAKQRRRRP